MGSASRFDPAQIKCADISESKVDKFAKQVRLKLREQGITDGVRVVYSTEEAIEPEQAVPGTEGKCICPTIEKNLGLPAQTSYVRNHQLYSPIFGMWLAGDLFAVLFARN